MLKLDVRVAHRLARMRGSAIAAAVGVTVGVGWLEVRLVNNFASLSCCTMGGECYKEVSLVKSQINFATDFQEAYEVLHPVLLRLVNNWRSALPDPAVWDFDQRKDGDLFKIKFVGDHSDLFSPLVMPLKLKDGGTSGNWHVGWQHRRHGKYTDPAKDLAETLVAALTSSPIRPLLHLDQMDDILKDLGFGDADDYSDDDNKDFTRNAVTVAIATTDYGRS